MHLHVELQLSKRERQTIEHETRSAVSGRTGSAKREVDFAFGSSGVRISRFGRHGPARASDRYSYHRSRARLTAGIPGIEHLTRHKSRMVPYGTYTSRLIDERTRRGRESLQRQPAPWWCGGDRYNRSRVRLTAGVPGIEYHACRMVPYGACTAD